MTTDQEPVKLAILGAGRFTKNDYIPLFRSAHSTPLVQKREMSKDCCIPDTHLAPAAGTQWRYSYAPCGAEALSLLKRYCHRSESEALRAV